MNFAELLGIALKLEGLIAEARAAGGAQVPVKLTIHSHGWTVLLNGTVTATKDGIPPPTPNPTP